MRTIVKLGCLSLFGVMVACGSTAPDAETAGAPPATDGTQAAPGAQPAPVVPADEAARINRLIAAAGHLNTDKKADDAPVATSPTTTAQVPGDNGTSYQCKYTDYSLTKVPEKFVALNPNADVLWPGSIVQGKSMAGGILDPVPVKRAPGTITLTLASGGGGPFFEKMDEPSLSAAIQAQNEILAAYTGKTPAKFSYSFESIYSSEQLAVAVDANVQGTNWSAAASLSVDTKDEKSRYLIQFSQEYFTMAFDPPQGAAGVFDKSVTAEDLAPYAAAGNPPVYVSGVTYGRIFYILFESTASSVDLEASVKGSYSGPSVSASASASASWKKVINESTVKSYGLGGNAEQAIDAVVGSDQFEKIRTFLVSGANFDSNNPGVPISYTIRHLTDSSQVKLALTTDYTAKDCAPTAAGCAPGQQRDTCGVCGGNGTTCAPCGAATIQSTAEGAYVNFNLGSGNDKDEVVFPDGSYYKYANLLCNRIYWGNVRAQCHNGTWSLEGSQSIKGDHNCFSDSNASWSSDDNSISTGWQP
jgi:hypothetical protein